MNRTLSYDDLAGRLRQLWALPMEERQGVAIKTDLFTRLLYQPERDWDMHLTDIATLLGSQYEQIHDQFYNSFLPESTALRAAAPVKWSNITHPPKALSAGETDAGPSPPLLVSLSEIEPCPVPWLWEGFIPIGHATLISGNPGEGKTYFSLDLAARLSRGDIWLDGLPIERPAHTIYLTVEDDPACTIRPRIDGLGGDPSRISVYNINQESHLDLSKPEGLMRLEDCIIEIGEVKLVIIDPIIDFSGKVNPDKAQEVRTLLNPLIKMASRHQFALVLIGHLNKHQAQEALYRAGGSTSGWLGKCRAGFIVFKDKDDRELRHVVCLKTNLAVHRPPQLEFELKDWRLIGRVSITEVDIDEQLDPRQGKKPRERGQVKEWLESLFVIRPEIPATVIEETAKKLGFSESTLKRAKEEAGFISKFIRTTDGRSQWVWCKAATDNDKNAQPSIASSTHADDLQEGQLT